jgi:ectoine hydroxylase-related dioxygenase (phytanoyl-CoA dioxygenase family)
LLPLNSGELILFPSNLTHSVPENKADLPRISLAFNTFAKNSLGSIDSLTYLPLNK